MSRCIESLMNERRRIVGAQRAELQRVSRESGHIVPIDRLQGPKRVRRSPCRRLSDDGVWLPLMTELFAPLELSPAWGYIAVAPARSVDLNLCHLVSSLENL